MSNTELLYRGIKDMPLSEAHILMLIAKPVVGSVSSSTNGFGKFGGRIPPVIASR